MKLASCKVDFIILKGGVALKNKIKECRTEIKMTQQELAQKVNVSSRTIISLEKEQYNPSLMLAYRIAKVFDTTVEALYCLQENKELEDFSYEHLQK